jgi:hypothetical protein
VGSVGRYLLIHGAVHSVVSLDLLHQQYFCISHLPPVSLTPSNSVRKSGFKGKGKGFTGGGWQSPYSSPSAYSAPSGGGSKGSQKGVKGGKGGTFDGTCNHCGKYGHRKNECRSLDAELAKQRGLNNVDENGDAGEEEHGGPHAGTAPGGEEDVWWMGATYSLTPEKEFEPLRAPPRAAVKISHRFDALRGEDLEDPTPRESFARPSPLQKSEQNFRTSGTLPRSEQNFPTSGTLLRGASRISVPRVPYRGASRISLPRVPF